MAEKKNFTEVVIDGKIYKLGGYESEEYLHQVASYINNKITELKGLDGYHRLSAAMKGIMLDLNVADDYYKAKKQADRLEAALSEKDKELYEAKHDLVNAELRSEQSAKKAEELRKEADELRERIAELEQQTGGAGSARRAAAPASAEESQEDPEAAAAGQAGSADEAELPADRQAIKGKKPQARTEMSREKEERGEKMLSDFLKEQREQPIAGNDARSLFDIAKTKTNGKISDATRRALDM